MILIQQLDQSPFCWKEVSPLDKKSPFLVKKSPGVFPVGSRCSPCLLLQKTMEESPDLLVEFPVWWLNPHVDRWSEKSLPKGRSNPPKKKSPDLWLSFSHACELIGSPCHAWFNPVGFAKLESPRELPMRRWNPCVSWWKSPSSPQLK